MRRYLARFFIAFILPAFFVAANVQAAVTSGVPEVEDRSGAAARLLEHTQSLKLRLEALQVDAKIDGMSLREVLAHKSLEENVAGFVKNNRIELELAAHPDAPESWLMAAQGFAKVGRSDDAATAAWQAYQLAEKDKDKALALERLATHAREEERGQHAVDLLDYALTLDDTKERRAYRDAVKAQFALRVTDVSVDVEAFSPTACIILSENLMAGTTAKVEDYVRLPGGLDVSLRANGNRICMGGLAYGQEFKVTVLAGLMGAGGSRLHSDVSRTVVVPNREARINFGNGTYVLPRVGDETVPLKTVNMSGVKLKLYRVSDRGLVPLLNSGVKSDALYEWSENRLDSEYGTLIWEGAMDVENVPNKDVTTLVPVRDLIDDKGPGIYALVAADPAEDKNERYRYEHQAQWLLISDLGMMTLSGDDGLHVFVHSLATTKAQRNVKLTLVARDNSILKTLETDRGGHAAFGPALLRGEGGASPAVVVAETDKGDYAFLTLDGPALDLSDRGTSGRKAAGPLDAYMFTERGIYRPGEVVHVSALMRSARAAAVAGLPLTFKVFRPDGMEAVKTSLTGDRFGGYAYDLSLSPGARTGLWRAALYADDEEKSVGEVRFSVDEFVPERLSTTLETTETYVTGDTPVSASVQADFLYGAPGADLSGILDVRLERDPLPFPEYPAYHFGLVQEDYKPAPPNRQDFVTGESGNARVSVAFAPLPDTSQALRARLRAEVVDVGGRPVADTVLLPVRQSPVMLGVKAGDGAGFDTDEQANIDIVALSAEGKPLADHQLTAVWVREHYQYNWYRLDGSWRFRSTTVDEVIAEEAVVTGAEGTLSLARMLGSGRYRIDVFDEAGKSASSTRFHVGWWSAVTSPDVPDALELTLEDTALRAGDRLRGFVKAPFEGRALITIVNERLVEHKLVTLDKDGSAFDFKVAEDWGPGAYVLATALRPGAGELSRLPVRATGLAWFSVGRKGHVVELEIDAPEVALPGKTVSLPIHVKGGQPGEEMKVILAAVDEGILNITRFNSPDPDAFYYGQRAFSMDLRDVYGRLIRPEEGARGTLRTGGDIVVVSGSRRMMTKDEASNLFAAITRTSRTVALLRRDITLGKDGAAMVDLDLPDFAGRLRLMAVAYGATMVGVGEGALTVRTPIVAELILPRFLAPGDSAEATLSVQNLSGAASDVRVMLRSDGEAVELAAGAESSFTLEHKERRDLPVKVTGVMPGDASLHLTLASSDADDIRRDWGITVRAAWPYATRRTSEGIAPGERMEIAPTDMDAFYKITTSGQLTLSSRPNLEADRMMRTLNAYGYRCSEQTVSRAIPALYYGKLSRLYDLPGSKSDADNLVERSIVMLLDRQKGDGSFGVWSLSGSSNEWIDAYVTDFLLHAAEAGFDVPDATTKLSLMRLKRMIARRGRGNIEAQAYAFYVLARVGDVSASEVRYFADQFAAKLHSPLARAQVAAALSHVGERQAAEDLFARAHKSARDANYYGDYGTDLRDRAAFAALLAEVMPTAPYMAELANILEREVAEDGWLSTQEMAWVARAAAAFAGEGNGQLTARVNDDTVSAAKGLWSGEIGDEVPVGALMVANTSDRAIRAVKTLRGVPVAAPEPAEEGLRVSRAYFDMDGKPVDMNRVKRNDRIVVLIEGVATAAAVRETLVVDMLPAGLEIETTDVSSFKFLPTLSPVEFTDARDDRFVGVVKLGTWSGWRNNRFRLAYVVRAVTPGDYVMPGAFAEDMYKPQYHAQGSVHRIQVGK
ncbi:MG2 domain-containing protein [Kordiimonas aestuarii]|uniref:MG2 domain-containing protein n=1 Tax=Kordiimonas aestuarii TaxID=1005925 RepID=UPI0021CFAECE|nr:MG2 domain-containing protein [Kordiimonas aestuarii]